MCGEANVGADAWYMGGDTMGHEAFVFVLGSPEVELVLWLEKCGGECFDVVGEDGEVLSK